MEDNRLKILNDLLKQEESTKLDFKREIHLYSDNDKYEFAKDVSAFANTLGGFIVYGKEDKSEDGKIVGIDPNTYNADQMHQIIAQRCNPPPSFDSELIKRNGKWFIVVEIPESDLKPHEIVQTREVWVRRGPVSDRATQKEREQMSAKKGKRTLEEKLELEGIPEEPESQLQKSFIGVGRWYTKRTYGKLDVSLRKEKIALGICGFLFFVPLAYSMFQIWSTHIVPSDWVLILYTVLAIIGGLLFVIDVEIPKLRCPKCSRQFAFRRNKHVRMQVEILHKTDEKITREITYRNVYSCDFCNYKVDKFEPETETTEI
ncbi:MAG: RNA-binding domain-containing protein [Nitrososphaeria archaeon]|jgi:hypothetical protein